MGFDPASIALAISTSYPRVPLKTGKRGDGGHRGAGKLLDRAHEVLSIEILESSPTFKQPDEHPANGDDAKRDERARQPK